MVADHLTRKPGTAHAFRRQHLPLRLRHARRLPVDELHATGGTARVAAAPMEDVDLRVLLDGEHETFPVGHVNRSKPFDRQLRQSAFSFVREYAIIQNRGSSNP